MIMQYKSFCHRQLCHLSGRVGGNQGMGSPFPSFSAPEYDTARIKKKSEYKKLLRFLQEKKTPGLVSLTPISR